jgi:FlaA1/EpsC-like NDP-sugar epimerase
MVRFGNVLGSSGSVVPKFKRQILDGGPITLTHSDVTRYFMTIPEAAQLVLQASAVAQGGEVFVLDMGEPVRIEELAITMVKLYGKRLQRDTGDPADIEIHVKGLRPGEELFFTKDQKKTAVEKITAARESWIEWGELNSELKTLETLCEKGDSKNLRRHIMKLAFTTQGLTVDKLNGQVVAAETCENMQETIDSSVIS